MSPGAALGVDFGTSHTVAVVRWPDGRVRPLLVDGSPLLPSAVYAPAGDAPLVVGRDAVHSARLDPARFEPNPKRRVDDGSVLLGEREIPVAELITAVLARVAEEWRRAIGDATTGDLSGSPALTLTCPATWGATRRSLLSRAAAEAGLGTGRLVAEPVAAATYFAEVLGRDVPIGSAVVVHDFGAGTLDASVVVRRSTGFEVLAVDGRDDLGGLDVDAALVAHLATTYGPTHPDAWRRLEAPATVEERRAKRQLWDDVRVAKERLSRSPTADLVVPLADVEAHLTRDELERVATPILDQTIRVTQAVLAAATLPPGNTAGVFLVGGSSRIPLLATLLHRALGEPPVVIEQPELVVAEGSVLASTALLASAPAAVPVTGLFPRIVVAANGAGPALSPVSPATGPTPPPVSVPPAPAPHAGNAPYPGPAHMPGTRQVPGAAQMPGAPAPGAAQIPGATQTPSAPAPGAAQISGTTQTPSAPPPGAAQMSGAAQMLGAAQTPGAAQAHGSMPGVAHASGVGEPGPFGAAAGSDVTLPLGGAAPTSPAGGVNGHQGDGETTDTVPIVPVEAPPAYPPGRAAVPPKTGKGPRAGRFGFESAREPALVAQTRPMPATYDEPEPVVYPDPVPPRRDQRPPVWEPPAAPRNAYPRKGPNGFLRAVRALVMVALLVATPLVSAVVAFHYATGDGYGDILDAVRDWIDAQR